MFWRKLIVSALFLAVPLAAQKDHEPLDRPPRRGQGQGRGRGQPEKRPRDELLRRRLKQGAARLLNELREKDPEKYAELMELRETKPQAFIRELQKLAAARTEGGAAGPKGKGKSGPGPKGKGKSGPGPKGKGRYGRYPGERFLEFLQKRNPEEFERLRQLREEDPEKARREIRKHFDSFRRKHFGREDKVRRLVRRYRNSDDEEEKARLKGLLEKAIENTFTARLKTQEEHLKKTLRKLEKLQEKLRRIQERKNDICAKHLKQLLEYEPQEPKLRHKKKPRKQGRRHLDEDPL